MSDRRVRLVVPLVVVTGVAVAATGAHFGHQAALESSVFAAPAPGGAPAPAPGEEAPPAPATDTLGLVSIEYRLNRLPQSASNQIAIWIEDADGGYVRTLFATSFTANGGYTRRPMSLPLWRETARWESAPEAEVESASRPAQDSGRHVVHWDGTDREGRAVPAGTYTYRVEGNLRWENRVLFTGSITVGGEPDSSRAEAEYLPPAAAAESDLVEEVTAVFAPGEPMDPADVTTYTRGS